MVKNSSLAGAELKLNRAREHVTSLEAEIRSFGRRHPQPVRLTLRDDPSPQLIPVMVEEVRHPDPVMGAIVGDALHNFRSALDYVAWELVRQGSQPERREDEPSAEQIGFPIIGRPSRSGLEPEEYLARTLIHKVPGIQNVHETIVRSHQPYRRRNLAERHPLALLQKLSNVDKHREVRPVLWAPTQWRLHVEPPADCQVVGVKMGPDAGYPLRVGAEVFYITVVDKSACSGLDVSPDATFTVAFQERLGFDEPVGAFEILDWIANEVADILSEIDRIL